MAGRGRNSFTQDFLPMGEVLRSLHFVSLAASSHSALAGGFWAPQVAVALEQTVTSFRTAKPHYSNR